MDSYFFIMNHVKKKKDYLFIFEAKIFTKNQEKASFFPCLYFLVKSKQLEGRVGLGMPLSFPHICKQAKALSRLVLTRPLPCPQGPRLEENKNHPPFIISMHLNGHYQTRPLLCIELGPMYWNLSICMKLNR